MDWNVAQFQQCREVPDIWMGTKDMPDQQIPFEEVFSFAKRKKWMLTVKLMSQRNGFVM